MKKYGLLLCVALSAATVAAPPKKALASKPKTTPARALPAFTFKAAQAGITMDPNAVGSCSPDRDGIPGKVECRGSDSVVAGVDLLVAPSYSFYNGRLTMMLYLFNNKGTDYLTFLGAFRDKYGSPCSTKSEKWQNKAGATFDNAITTWCFKTGKLTLKELGPSLDYGEVMYNDDVPSPSKETPKDF